MNDATTDTTPPDAVPPEETPPRPPPPAIPPKVNLPNKNKTAKVTFDPSSTAGAPPFSVSGGAGGMLPSTSIVQAEANKQFFKNKEQLEDIVNGLDFGENQHSLNIRRTEPTYFKGKRVGGHIADIKGRPSLEEIKQRWGGGKFRVTVMGPGPGGTRRIVTSMDIEIAGDPIPDDNGSGTAPSSNGLPPEVANIVTSTLEKGDRQVERLETEVRESRKEMLAVLTSKGDGGMGATMTMVQQQAMEDRRIQREQMAAEREERRRTEEAAERRAKDERDAAERRHQETLRSLQDQYNRQMAEMKADAERREKDAQRQFDLVREQQKADAEERKRLYELELKKAERSEKDRSEEKRRDMEFMTSSLQAQHTAQMSQLQALDNMKTQFFKEMVESSKKTRSPWQELIEAKEVFDTLSGNNDERAPWERVLDRVEEIGGKVAPSLLAAAGIGLAGRNAARQLRRNNREDDEQQQQPQHRRRLRRQGQASRVQPNSAAVVDITPPQPEKQAEVPDQPAAEAQATEPEIPRNDLTVLTFPKDGAPMEEVFVLLVKDIDYALERDFSAQALVDSVILKFPLLVVQGIKNMSGDEVCALLDDKAPPTWRINTPDGHKRVREAHALLLSAEAPKN